MHPTHAHCHSSKVACCSACVLAFLGIASLMLALFGGQAVSNWFVGEGPRLNASTGFIPVLILAFASPVFLAAALVVNRLGRSNHAQSGIEGLEEKSD